MQSQKDDLSILGRTRPLFTQDLAAVEDELTARVRESSFLVLGGAGSIGQAVAKAIFRRNPKCLHVVDSSENNLVELVRDIRSSYGYIEGDFRTLPLDIGHLEFDAFLKSNRAYDYVLNLAALKHVRSEKDPFSLMRMIAVNVLNTENSLEQAIAVGAKRYFAVSSDKAANPANAMGASKRAMEFCLRRASSRIEVSSARFANVAFSDGSLLHGFARRLDKRQPLSAPADVHRYFITDEEAATLCLMATLLAESREALFPNPDSDFPPVDFRTVAERFLESRGYRAHPCETEDEARSRVEELSARASWPCYFFESDTTGEKEIEEFCIAGESVDLLRYQEIGVIQWPVLQDDSALDRFLGAIHELRTSEHWTRDDILGQLSLLLPEFHHLETGKFLDSRM